MCNDQSLMIKYHEKPTRIGGSTADGMSPGRGKMRLRLSLKNGRKGVILDLKNVFLLPHSPSNIVSLDLLNNHRSFYDNKNEMLYYRTSKETLAYTERWRTSFLLHPLNIFVSVAHLTQIDGDTYKWPAYEYRTTTSPKFPLTTWHKRLSHLNFPSPT